MIPKGSTDSPKMEVGEIDTSSPFSSVKHAVSLFCDVSISGEKTPMKKARAKSVEIAFVKQMQFLLADKELNKFNNRIKSAETAKAEALAELEKAKRVFEDLSLKLEAACESRESAVKATEAANNKLKQLATNGERELDMEAAREQYMTALAELGDAKQELTRIRREFDAALEEKVASLKSAEEAERAAKANEEKAGDLAKDVSALKESIEIVKVASSRAKQEQAEMFAEKDVQKASYIAALEESAKKLLDLKNEHDPEIAEKLEARLAETESELDSLRKQMENVKASDLESINTVASALDGAKESLQKIAEEEGSLRSLVSDLKAELENVKKDRSEFTKKESEAEFIAGDLNIKHQRSKTELEACVREEAKVRCTSDHMASSLQQLTVEKENARRESESMLNEAEELRQETKTRRAALEENGNKLRFALKEAEDAKTAEAEALDRIKRLSETTSAARASTSKSAASITISKEEYESLSRKFEESDRIAEMKVSAAMAQVEAVKASENEAVKKLEANKKAMEEIKATTESVLRRADMAEAAKMTVEGELRRWRQREQKKAVEFTKSRSSSSTILHNETQKQSLLLQKAQSTHNLEKSKTPVSKKSLMHNFSGIFNKKKKKKRNPSDGGSPS